MGIRGLTLFFNNRSHVLYDDYILHNIDLVIDGCSLMYQLYESMKIKNCMFTGEYSEYAKCVEDFFTDLLRCKIRPIVIIDGGWEDKKLKTIIKRMKQRIEQATRYNQLISSKMSVLAYLSPIIFVNVMKKMKIKFVICYFEADNHIVSLSDSLNCPILSYDSDYYICGSQYIPMKTLSPHVTMIRSGYGKRCKIYRTENLLRLFRGLTKLHLPLISIILGNDYISKDHFKDFISKLIIRRQRTIMDNLQRKIFAIFNWAKRHSVEELIEIILYHIKPEKRQFILEKIENIINMYLTKTVSKKMLLVPLGIDENLIQKKKEEVFSFKKDINNLNRFDYFIDDDGKEITVVNDWDQYYLEKDSEDDKSPVVDSEDDEKEKRGDDDSIDETYFTNLVPEWFQLKILRSDFCCSFINIVTHQRYLPRIQVEDVEAESSHVISFPIIKTVCGLLLTRNDPSMDHNFVKILIRIKRRPFWLKMEIPRAPVTLDDLSNWDLNERIKLFNETMNIFDSRILNCFPPKWQLYVIAILYWMRDDNGDYKKHVVHLNTVIMSMLSRVITVDTYKSTLVARGSFDRTKVFKKENYTSIENCFSQITNENCYSAALFFRKNFTLGFSQRELYRTFSPHVVHTFSQFQSVLKHTMDLNNILGFIYPTPPVDELFNGTLMYNFYYDLCTVQNIYSYVVEQLSNSPPILYLYETLYNNIMKIHLQTDRKEERKNLRQDCSCNRERIKKLSKKNEKDEVDSDSDEEDDNCSRSSNRFCQLHKNKL